MTTLLFLAALLAAPSLASAQTEGVKVHGDWTIEVRRPDGGVVSRHEFRNALLAGGKGVLARLLAGQQFTPQWRIVARTDCLNFFGCGSAEDNPRDWAFQGAEFAQTLRQPLINSHTNFFTLTSRLDGNAIVLEASGSQTQTRKFDFVETQLLVCDVDSCETTSFSGRGVNLVLDEDNIVQITVVISFS